MRPKLIVLIPNLRGSGCERLVADMLPTLMIQFRILLLTYDRESKYDIPAEIIWKSLDSPNVEKFGIASKFFRAVARTLAISKHISDYSPDVILTFIDVCNVVGWLASSISKHRCPIIAAEHTIGKEFFQNNIHAKKHGRIIKFALGFTYARVTKLVVISEAMRKFISENLHVNRKIEVIYNGFDNKKYNFEDRRHAPKCNDAWPKIISVGTLNRNKNHRMTIQAFCEIKATFPNANLTIIGEGDEWRELIQTSNASNYAHDINIIGWSDSVEMHYKKADLLLHSSFHEGLPNVVLESFMSGLPVVCTPSTEAYKEVFFAPYCGSIISGWDSHEMAVHAIRVINKISSQPRLRRRLSSESMLKFSLQSMISNYSNLLHNTINFENM